MKVQTNISINYNEGVGGSGNGIVDGVIDRYGSLFTNDSIIVVYNYLDSNGDIIPTAVSTFTVSGEANVNALYDLVKASLPDINTVGYWEWQETLFYEAFKVEMVNTFADLTSTSQIDIVA